ncbi:MAG TPA: histidine kinase [Casimicrobiaceae bacterium]|nr:histidine kinase [Casimicrobiaceae bacterium]
MRRIVRSQLRWLTGLSWARVGWTCAVATSFALHYAPINVVNTYYRFDVPITTYVEEFLVLLPDCLVMWLVLMLIATVADNLPLRGMARKCVFALALVLGILVIPIEWCVLLSWNRGEECANFLSWPFLVRAWYAAGLQTAVFAAVIGVIWSSYRRDATAATALHEVALERIWLQRRTLHAGLKARQARVEPQFLLDNVTAIAASCEDDADRAERMIDELVVYLRAALPDDREEASTLGRELRMAEAYLELVSLRTEERVRRAIDVPAPLHAMPMSPALLLPLITCLMPHRSGFPAGGIDVRIGARPVGDDLRIVIVRKGQADGAAPDSLAITDLRVRLREVYGDAASLTVDSAAGADARVVLVLPRTVEHPGERKAAADERATASEAPFDSAYQGA